MGKALLIDTTKCVGCRSCQVSCKQWNDLPAETTVLQGQDLGLQNPITVSGRTFTVVTYNEVSDAKAPGGLKYIFAKRQCMHCNDPACAAACPVTALHKTKEGPVTYESEKCIGCRYCVMACPFGAATAQWHSLAPRIRKCDMCYDRIVTGGIPACVKGCPAAAITYGDRDKLLALGTKNIKENPGKYHPQIYGEKEAGGTGALYLSSVPFEQIGFPKVQAASFARSSTVALEAVPPAVLGVGVLLGSATYRIHQRREEVAAVERTAILSPAPARAAKQKPEFAPIQHTLWSPSNKLLAVVMALGAVAFLARFVLGLGGATNLSNTHPWGLWIMFNLIDIAGAAGAFAMAALIYLFRREDLYGLGRSAMLLGLVTYTMATITLVADVGLPWHVWQLLFQSPQHSVMFEVSWCIGLYVTILAFEFLPVPLETWKLHGALELWRKYANVYVVLALTGFTYLMSRQLVWTVLTLALFTMLARVFRTRPGQKPVPVMLALGGAVLSTLHQSSLGSLFLVASTKLNHLWWSPILPINFFLSALAGGTALVVLTEVVIARAYGRELPVPQLAAVAKVSFWSLLVYEAVRLGDLAAHGQLANGNNPLFLAEVLLGGILPLLLWSNDRLRHNAEVLSFASFFAVAGMALNRTNVVILAMNSKGPMPQIAPAPYRPSIMEWLVSLGVLATTIFVFGFVARRMPVLSKEAEATR
jgi:formate dehydrogenase iron-sulfur subunit